MGVPATRPVPLRRLISPEECSARLEIAAYLEIHPDRLFDSQYPFSTKPNTALSIPPPPRGKPLK